MTQHTQLVLLLLLQDTQREWYGTEIADRVGLRPSVATSILGRLHSSGWVTRRVEPGSPTALKRAQRHYYLLSPTGATEALAALAEVLAPTLVNLANAWELSIESVRHAKSGGIL